MKVIALGVKNADVSQLKQIASAPLEDFVQTIDDFAEMDTIEGLIFSLICDSFSKSLPDISNTILCPISVLVRSYIRLLVSYPLSRMK